MAKVTYSKTIPEPDRVLRVVEDCRATLLAVCSKVRPFGPAYHVIHAVVAAIDGLAAFITGERHYFATRLRHGTPQPTFPPDTLDLDASPHVTPEEVAPHLPTDRAP